jgi:hypothetical protein
MRTVIRDIYCRRSAVRFEVRKEAGSTAGMRAKGAKVLCLVVRL